MNTTADEIRIRVAPLLDRQLCPLGRHAMASLELTGGERVVDVGCGTGQTCLQLANAVGPSESVLGIDISPGMTAFATDRSADHPNIAITTADAGSYPFGANAFDAVYSRFGVMFFSAPVQAFKNLRRALKAGGKLCFVCWRTLEENDLDNIPLQAALPHLPVAETRGLESAPPFSFSQPDRVQDILTEAGFQNIRIGKHTEAVSSGDLDGMHELALSVGTLGKIIRENAELKDSVSGPVKAALETHGRPKDHALNAAVWIVSAQAT